MRVDRFEIDADRFESFQGSHPETIGKCGFLAFADFADKAAIANCTDTSIASSTSYSISSATGADQN